jgi:HrpA-like RNA helicase
MYHRRVYGRLSSVSEFMLVSYKEYSVVSATNIAETGITIPDITCVIDTGRQKEMRYAHSYAHDDDGLTARQIR